MVRRGLPKELKFKALSVVKKEPELRGYEGRCGHAVGRGLWGAGASGRPLRKHAVS